MSKERDLVGRLKSGASNPELITLGCVIHDARCLAAAEIIDSDTALIGELAEALEPFAALLKDHHFAVAALTRARKRTEKQQPAKVDYRDTQKCPSCGTELLWSEDANGESFQCPNLSCLQLYDKDEIIEPESDQ